MELLEVDFEAPIYPNYAQVVQYRGATISFYLVKPTTTTSTVC